MKSPCCTRHSPDDKTAGQVGAGGCDRIFRGTDFPVSVKHPFGVPHRVTLRSMADSGALRARRARAHANGDHELCRPGSKCRQPAGPAPANGLTASVMAVLAETDESVQQLGLRLAAIATDGRGTAAQVAAIRALGELLAAQQQ